MILFHVPVQSNLIYGTISHKTDMVIGGTDVSQNVKLNKNANKNKGKEEETIFLGNFLFDTFSKLEFFLF